MAGTPGARASLVVLRGLLDTRLHTVGDLEGLTNVPVVGRIAHDDRIAHRPLVVHDDPRSPRAEAVRAYAPTCSSSPARMTPGYFVVSSPTPSEGKTHVVANLASGAGGIRRECRTGRSRPTPDRGYRKVHGHRRGSGPQRCIDLRGPPSGDVGATQWGPTV